MIRGVQLRNQDGFTRTYTEGDTVLTDAVIAVFAAAEEAGAPLGALAVVTAATGFTASYTERNL